MLPGRLLRRVRFWKIDFRDVGSASEDESLAACGESLVNPENSCRPLWNALSEIAAELRPRSGCTTLPDLLDRLRGRFRLRAHPYFRADLERLLDEAHYQVSAGKSTLGRSISQPPCHSSRAQN